MDLNAKALEIHRRLCRVYGCPIAYFHSLDPLSELVSSLLSHRTRNSESGAAFKALRARYPDWAAVAAAPGPCTWHSVIWSASLRRRRMSGRSASPAAPTLRR